MQVCVTWEYSCLVRPADACVYVVDVVVHFFSSILAFVLCKRIVGVNVYMREKEKEMNREEELYLML
jgi:hypothetical protein